MKIKFRGKRVDNGEWVFGDLIHISKENDGAVAIVECGTFTVQSSFEVIPETVGMWTGQIDINGKEVFAGDFCEGKDDKTGFKYFVKAWLVVTCCNAPLKVFFSSSDAKKAREYLDDKIIPVLIVPIEKK